MRTDNKMKNKLNNAGMTLIEVLIAMVILAVVIAPLMRSFVQVAYYGNKGRNLQQASGIAQTIMENCKAYNMKTIQGKFESQSLISSDYTSGASWIDATTGDNYHYFIDGMTVDNREVGMEIIVKPMNTTVSGIDMPFEADFMDYDNVNDVMDAVFVPQHAMGTTNTTTNFRQMERKLCLDTMLMALLNHIKAADSTIAISEFDLWNDYFNGGLNDGEISFARNITIETINDSGFDKVKVTYSYSMNFSSLDYDYVDSLGDPATIPIVLSASDTSAEDSAIIYDNTATKVNNAALERIYFYYYPAYNNAFYYDFPCTEDNIIIKNNIGKDVDIYLIKQNEPTILDSDVELLEDDYDVKVQVQGDDVVNLYHNFRTNLGTPIGDTRTFPSETWPVETDDLTTADSVTVNDMNSLIIDENRKLMYTIEIKAYANPEYDATSKTMSGDELLSLNGTKVNW